MMIVVADTSPLVALVNIGHVDVLPRLFGSLTIPGQVAAELAGPERPQAVRNFIGNPPAWLIIRKPAKIAPLPRLHAGEQEAISLALELKAHLLLIDERDGRKAAIQRGLPTVRTAALLTQAADQGLLDLKQAFDRLRNTDFRIPGRVLDALLRQHNERQAR